MAPIFVFEAQSSVPRRPARAAERSLAQCPVGFNTGTVKALGITAPCEFRAVQTTVAAFRGSRFAIAIPV